MSEVGHCLILTARMRDSQRRKEVMGKETIFKFQTQEKEKADREWNGKVGGGATKTTLFLSPPCLSL